MEFNNYRSYEKGYISFLSCSRDERRHLIEFVSYIHYNNLNEVILQDSAFGPSDLWKDWVSKTFVGFSSTGVLLKGGHSFCHAAWPLFYPAFRESRATRLVPHLIRSLRRLRAIIQNDSLNKQWRRFEEIYPQRMLPCRHDKLMSLHPVPYMRALEVLQLSVLESPRFIIEVGSGACTNVALLRDLYGVKALIVDLPDTIPFGYVLLRNLMPELKIGLPQDIESDGVDFDQYDVMFMLPCQRDRMPSRLFDVAYNMASFQEMNIHVVNNYLSLLYDALLPGGTLVLQNTEHSRYIAGNSISNYHLSDFEGGVKLDPVFQNWVLRSVQHVRQCFYQAWKPT